MKQEPRDAKHVWFSFLHQTRTVSPAKFPPAKLHCSGRKSCPVKSNCQQCLINRKDVPLSYSETSAGSRQQLGRQGGPSQLVPREIKPRKHTDVRVFRPPSSLGWSSLSAGKESRCWAKLGNTLISHGKNRVTCCWRGQARARPGQAGQSNKCSPHPPGSHTGAENEARLFSNHQYHGF